EPSTKYRPQAGHPTGWLGLGLVLEACGKTEEARRAWIEGATQVEAELRLQDEYRKRVMLGLIYARLGQHTEARERVRGGLGLNPGHPWALFLSGEMEGLLGGPRSRAELRPPGSR